MPLPTRPVQLRCNFLYNPLGVHDPKPQLSWRLSTDSRRGAIQTAYRITVASRRSGPADLWDSGRVESDRTNGIVYGGKKLTSQQRAWWRVEVWDEVWSKTKSSRTSTASFWEMGLLKTQDWGCDWIGTALAGGPESTIPSPYLRTLFNVGKKVATARLYVTALGLYEFQINGQRIGNDEFTPGWTDYAKRVQYQAYDITSQLRDGANAAGAILGDGWYCGRVGWRNRAYYGDRPKLRAKIVITFKDGSEQSVVTDSSWKTAFGAIQENDIMHGESCDARRELIGWSKPEYRDQDWDNVETFAHPAIELSPTIGQLVRNTEEISPIAAPTSSTV